MRVPLRTAPVLLAALAVVIGGTAGCGHPGSGRAGARHSAGASPATGLPAGVVGATAVPTAVPNDAGARRNVTLASCAAAKDGWQASGTAGNPDGKRRDYTITVFFTTDAGTVIGTGQTTVAVKSHENQPWSVSGSFHPAPQTRCVLRGVG